MMHGHKNIKFHKMKLQTEGSKSFNFNSHRLEI